MVTIDARKIIEALEEMSDSEMADGLIAMARALERAHGNRPRKGSKPNPYRNSARLQPGVRPPKIGR